MERIVQPLFLTVFLALFCGPFSASGQSASDSLVALLPGMSEAQQADFINQNFYTLYSNDFNQALQLGGQALDIAIRYQLKPTQALSLKNLGIVRYLKGDYEQALAYYQQSLDLYETLQDKGGQGDVLREMANYFKKNGQMEKVFPILEKSIQLCTAAKDTNCISASLDILGVAYLEAGRLDDAEAKFKQELLLLERNGNENGLAYTLDNLAAVATEKGLFEQATELLKRARSIRERLGDKNGEAISITNLGETLLRAGQAAAALPYFKQAMNLANAIGFNDLRRHNMQMLSDCYKAMGEHNEALNWLQKSYELKDSLFNEERSLQLTEMATQYETEKKEKELARQQVELQRRKLLLILLALGIVLLAVVFFFVLRQQKMKQRQIENEAVLRAGLARSEISNRLQSERLRISRDLHDNLGAELTIIGNSLARQAAEAPSEPEKKFLEHIGQNARQAMQQLRETIWAIRYEQFNLTQLSDKIGDFAARATPIPVQVHLPEAEVLFSPTQVLNLYRIAQEAITNASKHARASQIDISFEPMGADQFCMRITDNGRGLDANVPTQGHGLHNMRIRAEELNGQLSIFSAAGKGATVELRFPVV